MTPGPTVPLIAISFRPVSFRLVLFLLCSVLYIGSFIRIVVYIQHHGHGHSPPIGLYFGLRGYIPLLEHLSHPFFFVFIRVDVARNASIHRGSFVSGVQKLCDQECSGVSGLHVEPCDACVLKLLNSEFTASGAGLVLVSPINHQKKLKVPPGARVTAIIRLRRRINAANLDAYWYKALQAPVKKKLSDGL